MALDPGNQGGFNTCTIFFPLEKSTNRGNYQDAAFFWCIKVFWMFIHYVGLFRRGIANMIYDCNVVYNVRFFWIFSQYTPVWVSRGKKSSAR